MATIFLIFKLRHIPSEFHSRKIHQDLTNWTTWKKNSVPAKCHALIENFDLTPTRTCVPIYYAW